jgi:3-phosphoshikimate 1-carboxyvinyltransferase
MKRFLQKALKLRGSITPPGDKSISHRAAMFGAIAAGVSTIEGFLEGEDCLSTLACLTALGVHSERRPGEGGEVLRVEGVGRLGLRESNDVLDAGNSGTTMRLLSGLLAGQPFYSVLTGDASLRSRPMGRVLDPLRQMGATVRGRRGDTLAPLTIVGGDLHGINYTLPVASAQLKSALILASLYASGPSVLREPAQSRDHTESMLRAMGAEIACDESITVQPLEHELQPLQLRVPGDMSAAAFWLVAAVTHPDAELHLVGVGMNPTRCGALDILRAMGADIEMREARVVGGEPVADLVARTSRLHGVTIGGPLIPRAIDEIPVLALAAALAQGDTIVQDAAELRVKESDRIHSTAAELNRFGARIEETADGMVIHGENRLRGAAGVSSGDHRLAMTLAIAGLLAEGESSVEGAGDVEISYPGFWHALEQVCLAG